MLSQKTKSILSLVFLSVFILIKASGLHAIAHDHDSVKDCIWCHLSGTDSSTPILACSDASVEFINLNPPVFVEVVDHYIPVASSKMDVCSIFNKPPPFTV